MLGEKGNDIYEQEVIERITRAEDRLSILQAEGEYGPAYDGQDGDQWASLFTDDGVYETRTFSSSVAGNRVQGRSNLAEFCNLQPLNGIHLMSVPNIVLADLSARVRVHFQFFAFAGTDELVRSRSVLGYYDVKYLKVGASWLMDHRITNYFETQRTDRYPYTLNVGSMEKSRGGPLDPPLYLDARS